MIAVDTNILVYAHRADSEWHPRAAACVGGLAEARAEWAIPWPCLHEFLAVVTHPRIYAPPTPVEAAVDQVEAWLESPSLVVLGESARYWQHLRKVLPAARAVGPRIHDARIAALCLLHGVSQLWTADRDFGRFPDLTTMNPLATPD